MISGRIVARVVLWFMFSHPYRIAFQKAESLQGCFRAEGNLIVDFFKLQPLNGIFLPHDPLHDVGNSFSHVIIGDFSLNNIIAMGIFQLTAALHDHFQPQQICTFKPVKLQFICLFNIPLIYVDDWGDRCFCSAAFDHGTPSCPALCLFLNICCIKGKAKVTAKLRTQNCRTRNLQRASVVYTFAVNTWVSARDDFERTGITVEELQERLQALGSERAPFESFVTSEWLIGWYSRFALGNFIDWDTAVCSFDSPEFAAALQMCKDWGQSGGTETLGERCILEFENIQDLTRLGVIGELYHDDYCYVGFPTSSGNGSIFELLSCFAISAQSDHQEAAWAFLCFALENLQPEGLFGAGLPASQGALNTRLQFLVETGETFLQFTHKIKESDAEQFRSLLENTTILEHSEQGILEIITEESSGFFAGNKTADETAALIQNRVGLYLMENR